MNTRTTDMTDLTEINDEATFSTQDVLDATGMTYRLLDYWLRTNVITIVSNPKPGSGMRRVFSHAEVRAIKRLYDRYRATVEALDHIRSGGAWMEEALDVA